MITGECYSPNTRNLRGKFRKNRFHKEDDRGFKGLYLADLAPGAIAPGLIRRNYYCSICKQPEHNAVKYRKPHN